MSSVSGTITLGKLRLYGTGGAAALPTAVYGLATPATTWTEGTGNGTDVTGIDWNSKPAAAGTALATINVNLAAAWNEWTITNYLQSEKGNSRFFSG